MGRSTLGLGLRRDPGRPGACPVHGLQYRPERRRRSIRSSAASRALYGSAPGPTARRMGAYLMWTAFAATSVTSSMFLTALSPNLLAVGLIRKEAGPRSHLVAMVAGLPAGRPRPGRDPAAADVPHLPAGSPIEPRRAGLGGEGTGPPGSVLATRGRPEPPDPRRLRPLGLRRPVDQRDDGDPRRGLADGALPRARVGGRRREPGGLGYCVLFRDPHDPGRRAEPRRRGLVGRRRASRATWCGVSPRSP